MSVTKIKKHNNLLGLKDPVGFVAIIPAGFAAIIPTGFAAIIPAGFAINFDDFIRIFFIFFYNYQKTYRV